MDARTSGQRGRSTADPVPVRLFGPLQVGTGAATLGPRDFGGIKPKQVLEILLLERGHPVPKDRIADLVWGTDLPRYVAATLETYVSVLRRHLGEAREIVVTDVEAYHIDRGRVSLDLDRFDALVERPTGGDAATARQRLEDALSLVRGDVVEDEPYAAWAEATRQHYRGQLLRVRLDAAALALAAGDADSAEEHVEEALAGDRLDERVHRAAMLTRYVSGTQQQALELYERFRRTLRDELDVEPTRATQQLRTAIEEQRDPAELIQATIGRRTAAPAPRPVGAELRRDEMEILLVEDSPTDARIIGDALRSGTLPVRVHHTDAGDDALDFLRRRGTHERAPRPDLVLLDLNLPGRHGQEILAEVKSDPALRSIPVVVLTTSASQQDIARSYDLHANSYLTKPADRDDFTRVVRLIESYWPATAPVPRSDRPG